MSDLIMVRHGQSEYNARTTPSLDSDLTEEGRVQIRRVGRFLAASVYNRNEFIGHTSPYLRTLRTAAIIGEETGVKFKVVLGPRETMTIYDYCKINDHRQQFPQFNWNNFPDEDGLGVYQESNQDYLDRIEGYVEEIKGQDVIVVSHGIPVVTMMEMRMGIRREPSMYHYVSNGSITHLIGGRLVRYNYEPSSTTLNK